MSFHSTHATSHALQPMHVVTSMYLHTSSSRCAPAPGTEPEWPEMARICKVPLGMMALCLLDFHQESLELRCIRIGIDDCRTEHVHRIEICPSGVLGDAAIAPMDRDT